MVRGGRNQVTPSLIPPQNSMMMARRLTRPCARRKRKARVDLAGQQLLQLRDRVELKRKSPEKANVMDGCCTSTKLQLTDPMVEVSLSRLVALKHSDERSLQKVGQWSATTSALIGDHHRQHRITDSPHHNNDTRNL